MATFPVFWYSSRRSAAKSRAYNGPRSTVYCPCTRFQAYPRIGEGVGARTEMERSRIKRDTALNHPPAEWKLTFNPRVHDSARMQTTCPRLLYHLCLSQFRSSRRISSFRDCTFIFPFLFFLMRLPSPMRSTERYIRFHRILFFPFLRSKFGLERMDILYKICKIRTCKESFWESIISARE